MYEMSDMASAVREVQKYLNKTDGAYYIAPSGVYDDITKKAVERFQQNNKLSTTGVVDYHTFILLYEAYVTILDEQNRAILTDSFIQFPLAVGYRSNSMIRINDTIIFLLDTYGIEHRVVSSTAYTDDTDQGVKRLREIYMLTDAAGIDSELYYRMMRDKDSIVRIKDVELYDE